MGVSSSAEFNFFVDPEAAQVVLDSFEGTPIYDLPWEIMLETKSTHVSIWELVFNILENKLFLMQDFRTQNLGNMGTPTMALMNAIEAKNLGEVTDYWLAPDPILIACVIDPTVRN